MADPIVANVFPNQNTAAMLQSQAPEFLPKLWKKGAELGEQEEDYFGEFEGKGITSPIRVDTDLSKGEGQVITFRTQEGLYEDGVTGDILIENAVEEWQVGDFDLTVDWFRHATRWNKRTEDQTAMHTELNDKVNVNLGKWLGRKKTRQLQLMLKYCLHPTSNIIINNTGTNYGNRDALRSTDTLTMDNITSTGQQLKTLGAIPAMVGRAGKNRIDRFIYVATGEALVSLQNSSDYKQAQRDGGIRGADNVIFKGGFSDVNGHLIREYNPPDHGGAGPIGSPQNPKALLGGVINSDDTCYTISGGGTVARAALSRVMYFESFSNYPLYLPGFNIPVDTTQRYCLIYNISGPNAGKMGFYGYTVNSGNNIVMNARLRAASNNGGTVAANAAGAFVGGAVTVPGANIASTQVGFVQWNQGVWAGLHTDSHPLGSIVIETNAYGVPLGNTFVFGASAAVRGYGRYRNLRSEQERDGGFMKDVYISSVFGQTPWIRTDGRTPNCLCLTHAISYAGLAIPQVI
jgi:hypothetical protein